MIPNDTQTLFYCRIQDALSYYLQIPLLDPHKYYDIIVITWLPPSLALVFDFTSLVVQNWVHCIELWVIHGWAVRLLQCICQRNGPGNIFERLSAS